MKKIHLFLIMITSVFLITSVLFGALQLYVSQNSLPSGIVVAGLSLGGLSETEAMETFEEELSKLEEARVQFVLELDGDSNKINKTMNYAWNELGVTWDAPEFREAVQSLSTGSLWDRAVARSDFEKEWNLQFTLDQNKLRSTFNPAWETAQFGHPINAVRSIDADDNIHYLPGHAVKRIQWAAFIAIMRESVPYQFYNYKESVIAIPLTLQQPAIGIDSLIQQGIQRKISQFTTDLRSSASGRVHNVEAAARSMNGLVLPPDGVFDYASIVEAAETSFGFREAPVILSGRLVPGIGGGICQVSSTLYNAVIRAGLGIVERRNHSLPVSYVLIGQDATFAKGYINFRFKNTTDHHLLISASVQNGQLTIKLFGDTPQDTNYDIESITTDVLPIPNKYVVNTALQPGEQETILEGKHGYIVETYRIKKVNDVPTQHTLLSRDTYPAQPTVIAVHNILQEDNRPESNNKNLQRIILEDGVDAPAFHGIYER